MQLSESNKERDAEPRLFAARAIAAAVLVVLALGFLVWRLMQLQLVEHAHFHTLSQENRVKIQPLAPTRGLIYDAKGVLLADNDPAYSLMITPEKVEDLDALVAELRALVPITDEDIERYERLRRQQRRFDGVPIRTGLSQDEVARVSVRGHRFPAVTVHAELLRSYPFGELTAHVLGYVGRINEREMERIDVSNYAGTSHIGKVGIERSFEDLLHGHVGLQQVEVNARGRVLREVEKQLPDPGRDLHLFLDIELQRDARRALGDRRGALVAIDPRSGGVLAMVSAPTFDPNPFVNGIGVAEYAALRDSLDRPLYNRAVRGQYPPGSTIKPFVALGGMALGAVGPNEHKFCGGYYQLRGHEHKYRCWKRWGHGKVAMEQAVVESCDVYFYDLAHDLGIDRLHGFMSEFGFGLKTGIDVFGEVGGLLPSREWKQRVRNQVWFPGETLMVGIGQGAFLATPVQLAAATAAMANRGLWIQPRVVRATGIGETGAPEPTERVERRIDVANKNLWRKVVHAMAQVVEGRHGTARRIASEHYRIAGKTGTAQVFSVGQKERYNEDEVAERMRDHALFVAFAPVDEPRIAVAVIVENGGHGGSVAAPVAKAVMDAYLIGKRVPPEGLVDDSQH